MIKLYERQSFSTKAVFRAKSFNPVYSMVFFLLIAVISGIPYCRASEVEKSMKMVEEFQGPGSDYGNFFIKNLAGSLERLNKERDEKFAKMPPDRRYAYTRKYIELVEKFSPHWLIEFKSISLALGWPENDYASYTGLSYSAPSSGHECTSWLVMPDMTSTEKIILHKNRDTGMRRLAVITRNTPRFYRWTGIGDLWQSSPCFVMNEKGLTAVMNSGDPCSDNRDVGLTTPNLLRLLAEQCATVDEAVTLFRKVIAEKAYAHSRSGSIFFLADSRRAVIIENSANHLAVAPVDFGFAIRANSWQLPGMIALSNKTPRQLLGDNHREYYVRENLLNIIKSGRKINPSDNYTLSRGREGDISEQRFPLCWDNTVSAATLVPDGEFPDVLTTIYFALGPPGNTIYLPLPMAVNELPLAFVNGEWGARALDFRKSAGMEHGKLDRMTDFENKLLKEFDIVCSEARALLRNGQKNEAVKLLNSTFRRQSFEADHFLSGL